MQTAANQHRQLSFDEAVQVAIDLLPGVRHDLGLLVEKRKNAARDITIGRIGLSIPEPILPILKQYHPELWQEDTELQGLAWKKFMCSRDSERFRVQDKI